jgi:hypothetical protein
MYHLYPKTFDYNNDKTNKAVLFLILKNNIHLINALSNVLTFYLIKPTNVSGTYTQ